MEGKWRKADVPGQMFGGLKIGEWQAELCAKRPFPVLRRCHANQLQNPAVAQRQALSLSLSPIS